MEEIPQAPTEQQPINQSTSSSTMGSSNKKESNKGKKTHLLLYYLLGIIEALLAFRFVLLLFGANIDAGFAQLIGTFTNPLMEPFKDLFDISGEVGSNVFSPNIIVAMIVYALVFYGLAQLIRIFTNKK